MTYLDDLSEYRFLGEPESGVLNVGWLSKGHPFRFLRTIN